MASFQEHLAYIMKNGLARSNRFEVIIPLPDAVASMVASTQQAKTASLNGNDVVQLISSFSGSSGSEVTRGLALMIDQTEIPGKNLTTTDTRYNGDFFRLPYSVVYGQQQFTFKVTSDMYEKNIIDEWMNYIYHPIWHEIEYMDNYSTDIQINQLDVKDNIVYSVLLKDAFPVVCNPITLANDERDQFAKLMTMFAYRRWERVGEREDDPTKSPTGNEIPPVPQAAQAELNPQIANGLDYLNSTDSSGLEGEAAAIYNQVDSVVRSASDTNPDKTVSLVSSLRESANGNNNIQADQKTLLLSKVDSLLVSLEG